MHFAGLAQRVAQALAAGYAIHHQCNVGFEANEIAIGLHEAVFKAGVTDIQRINHFAHGCARHVYLSQTTGEGAQEGGDPDNSQLVIGN